MVYYIVSCMQTEYQKKEVPIHLYLKYGNIRVRSAKNINCNNFICVGAFFEDNIIIIYFYSQISIKIIVVLLTYMSTCIVL